MKGIRHVNYAFNMVKPATGEGVQREHYITGLCGVVGSWRRMVMVYNAGQPFPRICGGFFGDDLNSSTMANLCRQFSVMRDRDVIDKTGITGVFDMHLESLWENARPSVAADGAAGPGDPSGPPIRPDPADVFAAARIAVQKLGLKLEPAKGSGQFLVIDHVEKPSGN